MFNEENWYMNLVIYNILQVILPIWKLNKVIIKQFNNQYSSGKHSRKLIYSKKRDYILGFSDFPELLPIYWKISSKNNLAKMTWVNKEPWKTTLKSFKKPQFHLKKKISCSVVCLFRSFIIFATSWNHYTFPRLEDS